MESSQTRDWTCVPTLVNGFFTTGPPGKPHHHALNRYLPLSCPSPLSYPAGQISILSGPCPLASLCLPPAVQCCWRKIRWRIGLLSQCKFLIPSFKWVVSPAYSVLGSSSSSLYSHSSLPHHTVFFLHAKPPLHHHHPIASQPLNLLTFSKYKAVVGQSTPNRPGLCLPSSCRRLVCSHELWTGPLLSQGLQSSGGFSFSCIIGPSISTRSFRFMCWGLLGVLRLQQKINSLPFHQFVFQLLSHVWVFATSWTAARQASLSFTVSWSLLKLMSIESVMPSNHLILYCPLLLLPSVFPSIKVFSSESALCIRWPRDWSFSLCISPSNEYLRLISFRIDGFDLIAVQWTPKSLLQHHSLKVSVQCSAFFMV